MMNISCFISVGLFINPNITIFITTWLAKEVCLFDINGFSSRMQ